MSDKTEKPIEFINSVEANCVLQIALKGKPTETAKLQNLVDSDFERVISAIQTSPVMLAVVGETITNSSAVDKVAGVSQYQKDFTPQQIIKFRKTIISLLEEVEEEEGDTYHGNDKLAQITKSVNALYANGTYLQNIKLLVQQVDDFFAELLRESQNKPSTGRKAEAKVKLMENDEDDDTDDLMGPDDYQICEGDMEFIKTIKSIVYSYIGFLKRIKDHELSDILKNEQKLGHWQGIEQIVKFFKRFKQQPQFKRSIRNIGFEFPDELEEMFEMWDAFVMWVNAKTDGEKK